MGTWGSGLYSNDSTVDVKEIYMQFLQQQFSNEEAYEKTKQDCYEYFGTDIEPLFWYALADTQWELGRLLPEVKSKALEWIEKKGGIDVWESAGKPHWKSSKRSCNPPCRQKKS